VIIGADKKPLALLQQEFPSLPFIVIAGHPISYRNKNNFSSLFFESLKFYKYIKKEHRFIDKIISNNNIDIIISDNRYGLWSKKAKSIIITHQLYIKSPIASTIIHHKIEKLIANFDECWIPDHEKTPNLSGDLSHVKPFKQKHRFIGALSRFSRQLVKTEKEIYKYDFIAIISGPEPQRTSFENIILKQLNETDLKAIIVRGLPSNNSELETKNLNIASFNHLATHELLSKIQESKVVICRAGYSSIMDLATIDKKAILIPTPGQTEQEYLAEYHFNNGNFYTQTQDDFNLNKALVEVEKYTPNFMLNSKPSINL